MASTASARSTSRLASAWHMAGKGCDHAGMGCCGSEGGAAAAGAAAGGAAAGGTAAGAGAFVAADAGCFLPGIRATGHSLSIGGHMMEGMAPCRMTSRVRTTES